MPMTLQQLMASPEYAAMNPNQQAAALRTAANANNPGAFKPTTTYQPTGGGSFNTITQNAVDPTNITMADLLSQRLASGDDLAYRTAGHGGTFADNATYGANGEVLRGLDKVPDVINRIPVDYMTNGDFINDIVVPGAIAMANPAGFVAGATVGAGTGHDMMDYAQLGGGLEGLYNTGTSLLDSSGNVVQTPPGTPTGADRTLLAGADNITSDVTAGTTGPLAQDPGGTGLRLGTSGEGLHLPTGENIADLGGTGLNTSTLTPLGDPNSFINNADLINAGTIGQNGLYTGPTLGDPNSYINSGTGSTGTNTTTKPDAANDDTLPGTGANPFKDLTLKDAVTGLTGLALVDSLTSGDPGDPTGPDLRDDQAAREARIKANRDALDAAFAQFNDSYYGGISDAYNKYYSPQLTKTFDDAAREVIYKAPGGVGSSEYARWLGNLERDRAQAFSDIGSQAQGEAEHARDDVQAAYNALSGQVETAEDTQAFGNQAVTAATAARKTPTYTPLTDLFNRYASLAANATLADRYGYGSTGATPTSPVGAPPLLFGGGGRSGSGGSVKNVGY